MVQNSYNDYICIRIHPFPSYSFKMEMVTDFRLLVKCIYVFIIHERCVDDIIATIWKFCWFYRKIMQILFEWNTVKRWASTSCYLFVLYFIWYWTGRKHLYGERQGWCLFTEYIDMFSVLKYKGTVHKLCHVERGRRFKTCVTGKDTLLHLSMIEWFLRSSQSEYMNLISRIFFSAIYLLTSVSRI